MRHRSSLVVLTLLVGAALAAVATPTSPSSAAVQDSAPVSTAGPGRDAATHDDLETTPLIRAAQALRGGGDPSPRVEATLALRDLFLARPRLGDLGDRFAGGLLARPTDGAQDPFAQGYTAPSTRRCSAHVCVHSVRTTIDAPPDWAWVASTLTMMEKVWRHHVRRLGYRRPAPDGARGGDARFDVYLKELGSAGVYGYCAPERRVPGAPKQASGYCVLDNDFARSQFGRPPLQTLRVTAAHEFFHAVQFAYDFAEDPWLLESTATWMEERFADGIDDNRAYLRFGQLARPQVSLDLFETGGLAHYGNWTFWEYLGDRFGPRVVQQVWRRAGTGTGLPDDYSAEALKAVLSSRGGLRTVYAAYAGGNTIPARTYPEGAAYPAAPVIRRTLSAGARRTVVTPRIDHLSSRSVRLRPASSLTGRWRLTVKIDGPDASRAPGAFLVVKRADGRVHKRVIGLNRTGFGMARLSFDRAGTRSASITLANASTRYRCDRATTLSCHGLARDERQRFTLKAFVTR